MKIAEQVSLIVLALLPMLASAQCDELRGDPAARRNWQKKYRESFSEAADSRLIDADSVLIYYQYKNENQTTLGMECTYLLAEKYAQKELHKALKRLYRNLDAEDSAKFAKSQSTWALFYKREKEFVLSAYVGYANVTKYGNGTRILVERVVATYNIIKQRIIAVEDYIENTSGG